MTNLLIHSLILLAVLTTFFLLVIAKVEKEALEGEVTRTIQEQIPKLMAREDPNGDLKRQLKNVPFDSVSKLFAKPDEVTETYNKWLVRTAIFFNIFIALLIVVPALMIYWASGDTIPFGHILLENAILFAFVGTFEFLFFRSIVSKYIPVKPSVLTTEIYKDLQAGFPASLDRRRFA